MQNISRKRHQFKLITQKVNDWEFVDLTNYLSAENPEQIKLFYEILARYRS